METKTNNISLKIILVTIGIGIWTLVLQNAGIISTSNTVYVIGGNINADVRGNVDVDNTVSISIDEYLGKDGKKYYYK